MGKLDVKESLYTEIKEILTRRSEKRYLGRIEIAPIAENSHRMFSATTALRILDAI